MLDGFPCNHSQLVLIFFRVLIGSPLSGQPSKRTGDVYKCPVGRDNNNCIKLELPSKKTICVHMCTVLSDLAEGGYEFMQCQDNHLSLCPATVHKKCSSSCSIGQILIKLTHSDHSVVSVTFVVLWALFPFHSDDLHAHYL